MNKELELASPTLPGLVPDVEAQRISSALYAGLSGAAVVLRRMPTVIERQIISKRVSDIDQTLSPIAKRNADLVSVRPRMAEFLMGYGNTRNSPRAAEDIASYVNYVKEYPMFAIFAALDDFKNFRVHDIDARTGNKIALSLDFAPSPIRLRSVTQSHVDRLEEERARLSRILIAKKTADPEYPSEHRQKMLQQLSQTLKGNLQAGNAQNPEQLAQRQSDSLKRANDDCRREYEAYGLEPVVDQLGNVTSLSMMQQNGWHLDKVTVAGKLAYRLIR